MAETARVGKLEDGSSAVSGATISSRRGDLLQKRRW